MSSKLAYSTEEKRELQKQLGCMNGIFQLFDRRYFLGQRSSGHNHKRLPPPPGQSGTNETEIKIAPDKAMEKDPKKVAKEKQRVSVESSRTSFSSTCSSTEPPSSGKSIFLEASSPIIHIEQPTPFKPLDLRDVVKDSMYREARSVSVKTMAKEEGMSRTMKHIDSPRPLQQHRSVQPRAYSHDKSNRNLREVSGSFKEEKDAPRFSYDGRESRDKLKSSVRLKELPRLSLDSRESSIRRSAIESRKNFLRDTQRSNETSGQIVNLNQEPGSNKRPSGLVARLMGLEALPDPNTLNQGEVVKIKTYQDDNLVTISTSSRTGEEIKHSQISSSPKNSLKAPASPRTGIASTVTKSPLSSRLPLEPAPWRQEGGSRGSRETALKSKESPTTTPHASPSVYGEIEKRLTELEFKKSGKDLRALKQILEAMQKTRKRLENAEQPLNFESKSSKCNPDYGSWDQHNHPVSPSTKGTSPPKRGEFPIMVIKPAKFIGKPRILEAKEISGLQTLRTGKFADRNNHLRDPSGEPLPFIDKKTNARTLGPTQSSKVPENMTGERLTSSRRISGSGSPRLQSEKQEMEKQSSPSTPSTDFSRVRKQSIKQPIRSNRITRKAKSKSTNPQQTDDQSCGFSRETRNLSQQGDTVSMQSEISTSLASQNDTEVTSRDWNCKISICQPNDYNASKCAARFTEDSSIAELATSTLEQPSPVSVLDATFYGEDSPSPVKKISNAFTDYDTLTCDETEWNQEGMIHLLNSTRTNYWSEFNHDKLENIRHLVHRITQLNATHTETTTDDTTPPCESRHPDHRYITEIFLASGFLELGSNTVAIQLHSSGHLLDPNLFHVLEKTNECTGLANHELHEKSVGSKSSERNRRKLIFDTVGEILVCKLALTGSSELWTSSNKAQGRSPSGEKLLEEVWSEINNLQASSDSGLDDEDDELISIISTDVNQKSADWEGHRGELPGLVLDIERLIFKDLISEVVSGTVAGLLDPSGRHCKQLFSN